MKSRLFLAVSLAFCFFPLAVDACVYPIYTPKGYLMYRISENYRYGTQTPLDYNYAAHENCLLWQKQTRSDAPLARIYSIVYKMSAEELAGLLALAPNDTTRLENANPFIKTLRNDPEAVEILMLAKQCERLRSDMNSAWYYPAKKDPQKISLEGVARKAMDYEGARFRSRYALQALRALLSLRQYEECINYWESVGKTLDNDAVTLMALRYVAGAYYNLGETERAKELYGKAGDTDALFRCAEREGEDAMETVYAFCPDAPVLRNMVERMIVGTEKDMECEYGKELGKLYVMEVGELDEDSRTGLKELREFCLKVGCEGRVSDPALWYYSAAFIDHLLGDNVTASRILSKAEQSISTLFIRESIRVLRIYLDALNMPWSASYPSQMIGKLRWLDGKILEDMSLFSSDYPIADLLGNCSSYYWNDMMRKIVLAGICPKLVDHHQVPLALAFANMADNRLLNHLNRVDYEDGKPLTMDAYRKSGQHNYYDWNCALFEMLDTVPVEDIISYIKMVEYPKNQTELFLKERGYTDLGYFRDIIGTRLLRELRYQEAEQWLALVPVSFTQQLNTYMYRDPFSLTDRPYGPVVYAADFKYEFAREMASLERSIASTTDPDRKALLLLKFATGMKSSITQCWALTFYGKTSADTDPTWEPPTEYAKNSNRILAQADMLFRQAKAKAYSPEVKAQIQLTLGNLKTVMEQYACTEVAASIRGHCDTYADYHLDAKERAGYGAWR